VTAFPRTLDEAARTPGELRAGGTDLQERRRSGVSTGPLVDLSRVEGLDRIEWDDRGAATIGALVRVDELATDDHIRRAYPGVAEAAGQMATPQVRRVGTLGGNLAQRTRCWYYRHPSTSCYKKGGSSCPAREGNHLLGVCFDLGPCVAPHPSTLAVALLAYEASVDVHGRGRRRLDGILGDGSDPTRDLQLDDGELLTHVLMPPPLAGERAAYVRATIRALAEWPLVEVVVRATVEDGTIRFARVAVGGVAPIPLRLFGVEDDVVGNPGSPETLERAAAIATEGATPLPMTTYKLDVLTGAVLEALEHAVR
jgi:xanthine dehydrogenase YagS FAD-binding subunit